MIKDARSDWMTWFGVVGAQGEYYKKLSLSSVEGREGISYDAVRARIVVRNLCQNMMRFQRRAENGKVMKLRW